MCGHRQLLAILYACKFSNKIQKNKEFCKVLEHFYMDKFSGMWIELTRRLGPKKPTQRLNPYSIGIWIEQCGLRDKVSHLCLNPYSIGIWIELPVSAQTENKSVLILILLEYG